MSARVTLRARFADFDAMERALHALHESRLEDYEAYGPVPLVELEHLMPRRGSRVRMAAAVGGLAGLVAGFGLSAYTAGVYGLITGGKPPVSWIPFVVVGFEFTILFAVLFTFLAVGHLCRFLPVSPPKEYDGAYSDEAYGVHVHCKKGEAERAASLLRSAGAEGIDGD